MLMGLARVVMLVGIVCAPAARVLHAQAAPSFRETETAGFRLLRDAPQMMYTEGVPHIDHQGRRRTGYDPNQSFFLIGLYHARDFSDRAATIPAPLEAIRAAGFNTVYPTFNLSQCWLDRLHEYGLRIIACPATAKDAQEFASHPALLAYDVIDEPDSDGNLSAYPARFDAFERIRSAIREYDPVRPVYVNNVAWIIPPNLEWWIKWQRTGDIACHDNYPVEHWSGDRSASGFLPPVAQHSLSYVTGIPESVSLSVKVTEEKKPVWFIAQAFADGPQGRWAYPTPQQLRAMVYAALVHGATGLVYFTFDNYVSREAHIYGISSEPRDSYGSGATADPEMLERIRELWDAATEINHELRQLEPWLLSATPKLRYQVYVRGESYSETPVRTLLRQWRGRLVLIVVNLDDAALDLRVNLPVRMQATDVRPVFGQRESLHAVRGRIQDHLAPWEVVVYEAACAPL